MSSSDTLTAAHAAVDSLRERVLRLEEENEAALDAVTKTGDAVTAAHVAGKAVPEKAHELALEESDRATRRLAAAKEALARAEAVAARAGREDEAARAKAALEVENELAPQIAKDVKRHGVALGLALRAMADCDRRTWAARRALQAHGTDGPVYSFPIPSLALSALLDEVAAELSAKRDLRACDRLDVRLPY